jgi:hypothetical protein
MAPRDLRPENISLNEEEDSVIEKEHQPSLHDDEPHSDDEYTTMTSLHSNQTLQPNPPTELLEDKPTFQRNYKTSFGCLLSEGWNFGLARQSQLNNTKPLSPRSELGPAEDKSGDGGEEDVPKVLWKAAGGGEGVEVNHGVGRIHRIADYQTMETLHHLQHQETRQPHPLPPQAPHESVADDPMGTIARVMIHALQQIALAAPGAPSPSDTPLPRELSRHSSRPQHHPPLWIEPTSSQMNRNPTYPLQNRSRYWTDGQDTIAPFNVSGVYGPGAPSQSATDPRQRWQSEYGVHDVFPYFEHKQVSTTRGKAKSSRHIAPSSHHRHHHHHRHPSHHQAGHSLADTSSLTSSLSNDTIGVMTEDKILRDMQQSEGNQALLRHRKPYSRHQDGELNSSSSSSGDEIDCARDSVRGREGEDDQVSSRWNHLSSDGSLDEISFHQQPTVHRERGDQVKSKRRSQLNHHQRTRDDTDPKPSQQSRQILPRPLVSHQLPNSATKGAIDWDLNSSHEDDDRLPSQRTRTGASSHQQSIKTARGMKPLQSEKRGSMRKQRQILQLAPHETLDIDESLSWQQRKPKRGSTCHSPPPQEVWYDNSSSDQSLTSASYQSLPHPSIGRERDPHFCYPTQSDYEPSTPTLSIASISSRDRPGAQTLSSESTSSGPSLASSPSHSHSSHSTTQSGSVPSSSSTDISLDESGAVPPAHDSSSPEESGESEGDEESTIPPGSFSSLASSDEEEMLSAETVIGTLSAQNHVPTLERSKVRLWTPQSGVLRRKR